MAEIDDQAFSFMQEASPDYIAGGALNFESEYQTKATSKFDTEMNPDEQEDFLRKNAQIFKDLYDTDPNVDRKKLSYKSYLENVNPELLSMRAEDYDRKVDASSDYFAQHKGLDSEDLYMLHSKKIWEHADQHYGDINRLRNMALGKEGYELF